MTATPKAVRAAAVVLPELAEGMEEGTIVRWLVDHADHVTTGQPIVEVETDKATTELEATGDGRLWHGVAEGATVAVGTELAMIGAEPASLPLSDAAAPVPTVVDGPRHVASPLARRLAGELRIDLAAVQGTGRRGRIRRADVLAAADKRESGERATAREDVEIVLPTRVQSRIAERMVQAKRGVPDFTISMAVDMGAATQMRHEMRAHAEIAGMRSPSVNDLVIKACALALREQPQVNAGYVDDAFHLHRRVNVGMAVATDAALLVPTITDADQRSLGSIAQETRRLARAARDGTATPADLAAATFTVSNLGMFGVAEFAAVINPPQAAILAVGAVEEAAVVRGGAVVVGRRMTVTLTCDHRIVYGATAAAFLGHVRGLLESPWRLIL